MTVVALLALQSCGGGDDLGCGGPFCVIPPGQPQATSISMASGNDQKGAPGRELPEPLEVLVTDDEGHPVPDVSVSFTIGAPGGALSAPVVRSDYLGRARVKWTLGPNPGQQTVQALAAQPSGFPLKNSPLTFSAEAVRSPPVKILLQQAPSEVAQNGVAFDRQPAVAVLDGDDQPVANVEVSASIAEGGGSLSGRTTISTDDAGRAAYSDLAIEGSAGPRTLRFSVADPPLEILSGAVQVGAGGASEIVGLEPLTYQGTVNSPVSPAPSVLVRDAHGNAVPGVAVAFTADRDGSVSPASVVTNEQGIAQVTSWTLGRSAGPYSLSARIASSGSAPAVFSAVARAGDAGALRIAVQPSANARSGTPLERQPAVQVVDLLGNPAAQPGITVAATISSGPGGSLEGASAVTDASGRAAFSGLTLSGLEGTYTLAFSAPSLTGVSSERIALTPGSAARLALVGQLSHSARSRVPLPTQPVIQLEDASGNPVTQAGVQIIASIASGGGTLGGTTSVTTNAEGRGTFTDLVIIGSPGPRTLRFASSNPAGEVVSGQITLPGVASVSVVTSPPSPVVVGTQLSEPVTWAVVDAANQPVADAPATFSVSSGGSVTPTSTASDPSGIVRLQSWVVAQAAGTQFVELQVDGAGPSRVTVEAIPDAASQLVKISGDSQSAPANSELPDPLVVRVVDQYGNGVAGVTVEWRTCDGVGDYNATSDPAGFASALQQTGPEPGTFCVMASSAGLSGSPVQFTFTVTAEGSTRTAPAELRRGPPPPSAHPRAERR